MCQFLQIQESARIKIFTLQSKVSSKWYIIDTQDKTMLCRTLEMLMRLIFSMLKYYFKQLGLNTEDPGCLLKNSAYMKAKRTGSALQLTEGLS